MTDREKELQKFHDRGQEDATEYQHHKPHGQLGIIGAAVFGGSKAEENFREDNEAYEKGHDHGLEQNKNKR